MAEFDIFSEHCFPTLNFGEGCSSLGEPYIGNCQYDGAGASLQVLYGNLKPRTTAVAANLLTFDQTQVRELTACVAPHPLPAFAVSRCC